MIGDCLHLPAISITYRKRRRDEFLYPPKNLIEYPTRIMNLFEPRRKTPRGNIGADSTALCRERRYRISARLVWESVGKENRSSPFIRASANKYPNKTFQRNEDRHTARSARNGLTAIDCRIRAGTKGRYARFDDA